MILASSISVWHDDRITTLINILTTTPISVGTIINKQYSIYNADIFGSNKGDSD